MAGRSGAVGANMVPPRPSSTAVIAGGKRRLLLLLLRLQWLLPKARWWARSGKLARCDVRIGQAGKLHVICVLVGLATIFVRMDVRLCDRHLHTIRDRRASGQCDSPRPPFRIFPPGQPKCKHHGRCRLCGHKCSLLKQVFVIFQKPYQGLQRHRESMRS